MLGRDKTEGRLKLAAALEAAIFCPQIKAGFARRNVAALIQ